ncbi:MAG: acetylglutamate kinase [Candidatus Latescibacteria bacterium]|jgi:acetylglutamate kinase|nr:acetylglutamate kinase [Candidatus Latescibacterota bacterium]
MENAVVIKIGGATIDQSGVMEELAEDLHALEHMFPIIVHGGGAEIGRYLDLLGKEFKFVKGLRVTDGDVVDVVEMVLSGRVNKQVVSLLSRHGVRAIGVSGKDLEMLRAEKHLLDGADIGFVGAITKVDTSLLEMFAAHDVVPVVSPMSFGDDGATYNVNADHAALEVAKAVACEDLVFISDVAGIYRADGSTIRRLTPSLMHDLIDSGEITGGMIPKVQSAVECVKEGVHRARIISWQGPGTLQKELASEDSIYGTVVTAE